MAETKTVVLPTNPADQKVLFNAIKEASNAMTRAEAERDFIKEVKKKIKEDYEIPPRLFGKLVKTYHKQTYQQEVAEAEDFQVAYDTLVGTTE